MLEALQRSERPAARSHDDVAALPLRRRYGDFLIVCGEPRSETASWLAAIPSLETRKLNGTSWSAIVRGTADFMSCSFAVSASEDRAILVLGTPFERSSGRRLRAGDLLARPVGASLGDSLWGQFTIALFSPDAIVWLTDLERSMSPWWSRCGESLLALRFAPRPSCTGARLDAEATGEFLLHGIVGGTKTPIANWELFPARSCITWKHNKSVRTTYTHPIDVAPVPAAASGLPDAYRQFAAQMSAVVASVSESYERVLLPLTGGIDSRLILAALTKTGVGVDCYTHGQPGCGDDVVTQQYRRALPLQHHFYAIHPQSAASFPGIVRDSLSCLGPDYDAFAYAHVVRSYAAEPPEDRLFMSGVGTGIHKIPYTPLTALDHSPKNIVDAVVHHYGRPSMQPLLQQPVGRRALAQMRAAIAACLEECPPKTRRVHRIQYYHLQERLGRWAGKGIQLQDMCGYDVCYPFLAPPLMQSSRDLGYFRLHFGQKIIRAMAHLDMRLLGIDNANGWPVTVLCPSALVQQAPKYWRGLRNYAYRRLNGRIAKSVSIVDYRDVYRHVYRDWVVDLLDPARSHLTEIVRAEALQQLVRQLQDGQPLPRPLGSLAALELWVRS